MGKLLRQKDYRAYYGKSQDYDWFMPEPGVENYYMDVYTSKNRLVPSLTAGSTGNSQAYTISQGDSGRILTTDDVTKNSFEMDQCIPSIAENCTYSYCPKRHLAVYQLVTALQDYLNTTYTGESKPYPYIIRNTTHPIKQEYCLYGPTLNNTATWYYWNGSTWTSCNWAGTYYYKGGYGREIPPGELINLLGYKLYLFKCDYGMTSSQYGRVGEYLEYEANNFDRAYLLSNFTYKTYGNGMLKNWVYNNPLQQTGRTGFIYKDNRIHTAQDDNMTCNVNSFVYPFLNSNITADLEDGYNVIGLEFAVSDLTYSNWTGTGDSADPDIGGTHIVNCEKPFITPRVPLPIPATGESVNSQAMARAFSERTLNLYPEILTTSDAYQYYGNTFNEVYYWMPGDYRTLQRYVYGLFYYFPICDFYFSPCAQNNLLYTMNRMGIEQHFYGQASPKTDIFGV